MRLFIHLKKWRFIQCFSLIFIASIAFGCAQTSFRTHPEHDSRLKSFQTLVIMTPQVSIYDVSTSGLVELRSDWSVTGRNNIVNALISGLKRKKYKTRVAPINDKNDKEMKEVQTLYEVVQKSIRLHTYGSQPFPEKLLNFNYSLGSVESILKTWDADGLIFITGIDYISQASGKQLLSFAVADGTGTIIWYDEKSAQEIQGFRNPQSVANVMGQILASFPGRNI